MNKVNTFVASAIAVSLISGFADAAEVGSYSIIRPDVVMQRLHEYLDDSDSTTEQRTAIPASAMLKLQVQNEIGIVFRPVDASIMTVEFPATWQHAVFVDLRDQWFVARDRYLYKIIAGDCAGEEKRELVETTSKIVNLLSRVGNPSWKSYRDAERALAQIERAVRMLPDCPSRSAVPRFIGVTWQEFKTYISTHSLRPIMIDQASTEAYAKVVEVVLLSHKRESFLVRSKATFEQRESARLARASQRSTTGSGRYASLGNYDYGFSAGPSSTSRSSTYRVPMPSSRYTSGYSSSGLSNYRTQSYRYSVPSTSYQTITIRR